MADSEFEIALGRMFDTPPAFADSQAFARAVEHRLDRGWGLRQVAIGTAGLIGGLIAVGQILGSGLLPWFDALSTRSAEAVSQGVDEVVGGLWLGGLPMSGEVIWMAVGLGAMALALALTRLTQEL